MMNFNQPAFHQGQTGKREKRKKEQEVIANSTVGSLSPTAVAQKNH
jgi:hypothetical protein